MTEFIPHNDVVLCKMLNSSQQQVQEGSIVYQKEDLPVYEILQLGELKNFSELKAGDKIVSNSIPTKIVDDSGTFYLIREEYIAGKISE